MSFKSQIIGKALTGFVFKTINNVHAESICRINCFIESNRCVSYNYNTKTAICELSESDHVMHQANLVDKHGSVYNGAKNTCNCKKNEICSYNHASSSLRCTCNDNYPGSNCSRSKYTTTGQPTSTGTASTMGPTTTQQASPTTGSTTTQQASSTTGSITTQQASPTTATTTTKEAPTATSAITTPDCELYFKRPSTQDYVEIPSAITQEITAFTFSFWLSTPNAYKDTLQVFSYYSTDLSSDYSFGIKKDGVAEIKVNGGGEALKSGLKRDDSWQNFIVTWSNTDGLVQLYRNGIQEDNKKGMQTGKKVKAGGTMYLGQKHSKDGFDKTFVFRGSIADFEIWSNLLSAEKIYNFKCQSSKSISPGQIISWKKILDAARKGQIEERCPASCHP